MKNTGHRLNSRWPRLVCIKIISLHVGNVYVWTFGSSFFYNNEEFRFYKQPRHVIWLWIIDNHAVQEYSLAMTDCRITYYIDRIYIISWPNTSIVDCKCGSSVVNITTSYKHSYYGTYHTTVNALMSNNAIRCSGLAQWMAHSSLVYA